MSEPIVRLNFRDSTIASLNRQLRVNNKALLEALEVIAGAWDKELAEIAREAIDRAKGDK